MNVIEYFSRSQRKRGRLAALVSGTGAARQQVSFDELAVRVDRAVQRLRDSNLQPGDRVLLAVPLSVETYVAMLAILKAGLVIMFVDPAHGRKVFAACLRAHPPAAIIATRRILRFRWLSSDLRKIPLVFTVNAGNSKAIGITESNTCDVPQEPYRCTADMPALFTFTSGSTGEPKAVVRSHGFLGKQFAILGRIAELRDGDIDLVAMPMFVLFNLANGITSVIPGCDVGRPGSANAAIIAAQLDTEKATRMVASPALLGRLADYCDTAGVRLTQLRRISTGGGPVPPALPGRLKILAPNAAIVSVYGSTEAEPIACIDNCAVSAEDLQKSRLGAGLLAGTPVDGCEVRIIRYQPGPASGPCSASAFDLLTLADRQIGEIVVSGEHVLQGYADIARNAETKIEVDGTTWHRTGDAGYFDERGRLWLAGRCKAAISDARGTLYPFQAEYAACSIAGIQRAALVADRGYRILAVELKRWRRNSNCRDIARNLPGIDVDRVLPVKRIPMDRRHNAKVDYPALRRMLRI